MILFFFNSILLGVGLAMDAFSVSMANGLEDPHMPRRKVLRIAGCFAFFQFAMPTAGWFLVHTAVHYFTVFQKFIPWIALILLSFIGGKMIYDGTQESRKDEAEQEEARKTAHQAASGAEHSPGEDPVTPEEDPVSHGNRAAAQAEPHEQHAREAGRKDPLTPAKLILQGIATSIDALSVGFTIAEYGAGQAFAAALIIALVTLVICIAGVALGRKFGMLLAGKATTFGGCILIGIGIEIFLTGLL